MEAITRPRKKKKSSFLITINTNLKARSVDLDPLAVVLRATLNEFFKPENLVPTIKFVKGQKRNVSLIKSANVKFAIERGTKVHGGRLHAHCLVDVVHYSMIQFHAPGIKEFVMEDMNERLIEQGWPVLKGVYVNIKHVPNAYNVLKYLKKTGKSTKMPKIRLADKKTVTIN